MAVKPEKDSQRRWRTIVLCTQGNELLMVEMVDPLTKKFIWSLPGGGIEQKETPLVAAKRELFEETGHEAEDWAFLEQTRYDFGWNGRLVACLGEWFCARTPNVSDTHTIIDAHVRAWAWIPLGQVSERLAYQPHVRSRTLHHLRGMI